MKMGNWLQDLWIRIVSSDNAPLLEEIKKYKHLYNEKQKELETLNMELANEGLIAAKLRQELSALKIVYGELKKLYEQDNKHSSISTYKDWLFENVKPSTIYYNFDGTGKKRVHLIFKESLKDESIIRDFVKNDVEFDGSQYETADEVVINFNRKFSRKFPTRKYYRFDKELYGTIEVWKKAKDTIEILRKDSVFGDCDDVMTLKYSCLYYILKDFFPDDIWRLRGFIVDIWTGGGHAMLGWVKGGDVNDWVPIETTFYDIKQSEIWRDDYRIRNQMLYDIRYSFDDKYEYARI